MKPMDRYWPRRCLSGHTWTHGTCARSLLTNCALPTRKIILCSNWSTVKVVLRYTRLIYFYYCDFEPCLFLLSRVFAVGNRLSARHQKFYDGQRQSLFVCVQTDRCENSLAAFYVSISHIWWYFRDQKENSIIFLFIFISVFVL